MLDHLKNEFEKISEESKILEKLKETKKQQTLEQSLKQQPFLTLFHSVHEKDYVNKILAARNALPQTYLGRKLEYAFEVDYFWIEHHGKFSGFLGHSVHVNAPRTAKKILSMRRGKTSSENILLRSGLLFPNGFLPAWAELKLPSK